MIETETGIRDPSIVTTSRKFLFGLLIAIYPSTISAQGLSSLLTGKPSAPAAAVPDDSLKRGTPQSAMRAFLEACHSERFIQASLYLDLQDLPLRQRTTEGPELAKQLGDLLDRDSHFELNLLSDSPAGTTGDRLPADRDLLVSISLEDAPRVNLFLQRESKPIGNIWLVSRDSVAALPRLSAFDQESPIEKKLPAVLVSIKLLGTSLWVWFALVLAALILSLVSRLLSRIVIAISKPVAKRYAKSFYLYRFETFTEPLRLLLSVTVFRAVIEFLDPSALLRDYLLKLLTLLFALGIGSLIMRVIDLIFDQIQSRLNHEQTIMYSVLPLSIRVLKVLVFAALVVFTLSGWGYNTTAVLAGVGVGGLAVALAAQKTIENFFGGVSVITDRPVLIGDFCQFGGQVGTVEDIGLRSTRIRTLDRTLVTIPNSQFSTMTLENYSRRDRMWFHPTLKLHRGTPADQIPPFMEKITQILKSEPMINIGGVPLRFTKIDDQALNIEIFAYVPTADYDQFLQVQTKLLLQFLKAGEEAGVSFAMPLVETLNKTSLRPGS